MLLLLLLLLSRFSGVRPCATHRRQPTRLPRLWDSPGKNTGVGCHFLLQCMKVKSLSRVQLLATSWTAAYQAPPSMGFFRQEYWSGVPLHEGVKYSLHDKCSISSKLPSIFQYSCLENSMDRGDMDGYSPWGHKRV